MRYLSVCSGIEAATVAWHPLGWEAVAYSEIERFPSEVLAYHYPNTPNVGDMTKFKEWTNVSNVDLLVGGTPCQSFSVAGLRKGLDDPRGNLMLTYLAIAKQYRPNWLVWENVPGVLSSNGGLDFASLLRGMGELGYGFAYRILDAQYFGVAQRRRRVFVVGYLGDWRAAAAVLFERHSLSGHPAPSREKRQSVANSTRTGAQGCSHWDGDFPHPTLNQSSNCGGVGSSNQEIFSQRGAYLAPSKKWPAEISSTLDTTFGTKQGLEDQHVNAGCPMFVPAQPIALAENTIGRQPQNGGNGDGFTDGGPMYTFNATGVHGVAQPIAFSGQMSNPQTVMQPFQQTADCLTAAYGTKWNGNASADNGSLFVKQAMAVRRLTPKECERLQGFPDNYTDIKSKNKPTPDGPRYKALGNSMAVPVMRWIGERIQKVEALNVP